MIKVKESAKLTSALSTSQSLLPFSKQAFDYYSTQNLLAPSKAIKKFPLKLKQVA